MSDLRQTLNKVLGGSAPPEEFLKAIDQFLADPKANIDALRSVVDAAEKLGLDDKTAKAARERITKALAGDPDKTEITGTGDPDKTEITGTGAPTQLRAQPDPDKTLVTGGDDKTEQVGGSGDDPFAMTAAPPPGDELGPGSVLKQRFRLEQVIGQGGMGAVYKAVDLLKVEARDRNPYIAVKLLVGDFKEHPEAFIALQRESAKAQRLAHPNIATVYDFDRDGETVYMTMELMIGAELAKYIKKLPAGGLPVPDAMKIIEQLCAGLEYAHGRGLVHSDFKPGNAFVLEDGTVKLLDFGVARASKTKTDAEGESTVFDPGQLGALTPAYATIEMFEGEDPDPRDDLYALACVSYELLTGKHPFNKMSAVKAKEKGLKPAPVQKLNKRQNRALLKGLALHRKDRIESVEAFWDGLRPKKDYTLQIAAAATAGVLLIGALSYNPILNFIHEREYAALVTEIESGDEQRLVAALEAIDAMPPARMREAAARAQPRIVAYFENRADAQIDESQGRFNYANALGEIDKLDVYFPDSAAVQSIRNRIETQRERLLANLGGEFQEFLDDGKILPNPDERDMTDVISELRVVQPENDMLNDQNLVKQYVDLATQAVNAGQWERADSIVDVGLGYKSDAPELRDLHARVETELRRREEATLVAQLQGQLRGQRPTTIEGFREILDPLQRLTEIRPDDSVVGGLATPLRNAVSGAVQAAGNAGEWANADAILVEFARALPMDTLISMRTALSERQRQAGYNAGAERATDIQRRIAEIRTSLRDPGFDEEFERTLTTRFKELTARVGPDRSAWEALRKDVADAHIAGVRDLMAEDRYRGAADLLAQGRSFHTDYPPFRNLADQVESERVAFEAEQALQRERDRIVNAKNQVLQYARANDVEAARNGFEELRRTLPADDEFRTTEGPQALAAMYQRLAEQAGNGNRFSDAARLARVGLQVAPNSEALRALLGQYESLAAREEVVAAAAATGNLTAANFGAFRNQYQQVRQGLTGNDANTFERDVVNALSQRMTALDRADRINDANDLRTAALQLFPGDQRITQLNLRQPERPSQFAPRVRAALEDNKLTQATNLYNQAQTTERGHSELAGFPQQLQTRKAEAERYFTQFRAAIGRGDRSTAQNELNRAMSLWTDNPTYIEQHDQNFKVTTAPDKADDGSQPCVETLAGHGTQGRAACFDMPGGNRGPMMVVVPGIGGGQPFAIGKYEIAKGDFNRYCQASGACQQLSGSLAEPVTGITRQQANAYIAWLNAQTGKDYRIPTDAEWVHAARAGGNVGGSSGQFNCRVVQGGNVIKGLNLVSVATDPGNGWGLRNHIGNAQEWTLSGGTLQARGGSLEDPVVNCGIDLVKPHSGAADATTGFRVARSID